METARIDLKDTSFLELAELLLNDMKRIKKDLNDSNIKAFNIFFNNKKISIIKTIYDFLTKRHSSEVIAEKLSSSAMSKKIFYENFIKFIDFLKKFGEDVETKPSSTWFQITFGVNNKKEQLTKNLVVDDEEISYEIDEKDYFSIVNDIQLLENGIQLFFDALTEISKKLYVFCKENKINVDFKVPVSLENILNFHDSIVIHYHSSNLMRDKITSIFKNELELRNIFKKRILRKKSGIDIPNKNSSFSDAVSKILAVRFVNKFVLNNSFVDVNPKEVADFFKKELILINNYDNDLFLKEFAFAHRFIDKLLEDRYN